MRRARWSLRKAWTHVAPTDLLGLGLSMHGPTMNASGNLRGKNRGESDDLIVESASLPRRLRRGYLHPFLSSSLRRIDSLS